MSKVHVIKSKLRGNVSLTIVSSGKVLVSVFCPFSVLTVL